MSKSKDKLLYSQLAAADEFINVWRRYMCTCQDQSFYVAGQYFITRASTNQENCKYCNQQEQTHDRSSNQQ